MTVLSYLYAAIVIWTPHVDGSIEEPWKSSAPLRATDHYSVWEKVEGERRWIAIRGDRPTPVLIVVTNNERMRLLLISSTSAEAEYRHSEDEAWLTRRFQYFVDNAELQEKFNRTSNHVRDWHASHSTQGQPGEYEAWISADSSESVSISFYTRNNGLVSVPRPPADAVVLESWIRGSTPDRVQLR